MSHPPRSTGDEPVSGWARGGITFAACVLTLIGAFQLIAGLTAIIDDDFYVVARRNKANKLRRRPWQTSRA